MRADSPAPSAAESSGDELEALLMAELEDDVAEAGEDGPPSPKRQKTGAPSRRGGGCPPHPGYMGGICIRCGALKPAEDVKDLAAGGERPSGGIPLALRYIHHGLEVSREEAARLRADTVSRSLAARRLLLILDLDHTLLHSTRFSDLSAEQEAALLAREAAQEGPPEARLLHRIPYMSMWTKLRPGIREFLAKAHELYDLHVFTMGDKDYAAGMAALLDPGGRLFGGRVASSSDAGPGGVKDVDVLLGAEEMVMIMDDTVGVWPRHRANVLQVERYVYFPGDAARFGRPGQSLMERGEDEDATRGALGTCLRVLTQVHDRFFAEHDAGVGSKEGDGEGAGDAAAALPDARALLAGLRAEILAGCVVLFSRLIPRDARDPTKQPVWQMAVALGAKCVREESDEVTHVVAGDHTDKTRWARQTGRFVVSSDWMLCSMFTWHRAEEERFQLGAAVKAGGGTTGAGQPVPGSAAEEADVAAALAAAGGGGGWDVRC